MVSISFDIIMSCIKILNVLKSLVEDILYYIIYFYIIYFYIMYHIIFLYLTFEAGRFQAKISNTNSGFRWTTLLEYFGKNYDISLNGDNCN